VLFVCTGNQCRSPMAEALLRSKLPPACGIEVDSAGTIGDGTPPPDNAVKVMEDAGLDISERPSRPLDPRTLEAADLVVTMSRQHLVDVVTTHPPVLERAFTFADLLDRAATAGPRRPDETVAAWARRLSAGRTTVSILQLPSAADIEDPIGGGIGVFEQTRILLDRLTSDLAALLTGEPGGAGEAGEAEGAGGIMRRRRPWWRSG